MGKLSRLFVFSLLLPGSILSQQVNQTWTFNVGGLTRKSIVYVPSGINNPPLLISMHGMGIPASMNQGMMKFEPIADREKFIVTYPESAPGSDLRWDLGGDKDIKFIEAIIDSMDKRFSIDRNRVYASGFSMGGMMSYYLACKIPEKIAAIAPGCGYPLGGQSGCTKTRPVPIFHIHGTADDFVAYSNLHNFLNNKIREYGCPQTAQRTEPYPVSNPNSKSFKEYWGPCTDNNGMTSEITLISVTGMIHDWATPGKANANDDPAFKGKPFDVNGSEEAWAYLKTQSLTGAGYRLAVSTRGRGEVTRSPDESYYKKDTQVTLKAEPSEGWVFEGWSGDANGNQNPLTVTMNSSKSITASFVTEDGKRDLVLNGNFSSGTDHWTFNNWSGKGTGSVVDGEYRLTISETGNNYYDIQVVQPGILLEQGKAYRLVYDAYASANRVLNINVGMPVEPWTTFLTNVTDGEIAVNLTASKQTFTLDFIMEEPTYEDSRVEFSAATATPSVYIDNVSLYEIQPVEVSLKRSKGGVNSLKIRKNGSVINFTFNTSGAGSATLGIYDLKGKVVHTEHFKAHSGSVQRLNLETSVIPEGYYIAKISRGNTAFAKGFVVTGR
ncbi:MAG: hypothetical protein GX089_06485 [Fibrobacter sp.]|nr:hypothetical protein [Fibrobacter sp.]